MAIQKHLQTQGQKAKAALRDLNHGDWKEAEALAKKRYDERFRTRARTDTGRKPQRHSKPYSLKIGNRQKRQENPKILCMQFGP